MTAPGLTPAVVRAAAPLVFTGSAQVVTGDLLSTSVVEENDPGWADEVVGSLGSGERAFVSLAFTPGGRAVAHRVRAADSVALAPLAARTHRHSVVEVPPAGRYGEQVTDALARIASGEVAKVVLGRCLEVVSAPPLDPTEVTLRLLDRRPGRFVFSMPLDEGPSAPTLVGASPELLVRRRGALVESNPLAGSVPRSEDPVADKERADALRESGKDLAEHAFVVEQIVAALTPYCAELVADPRPEVVGTPTLWHLGTLVKARLLPGARALSALRLAQLLHPTPAVGGAPTRAALDLIGHLEGDLRGPLAGAVGWVDAEGDGEFAVAIRAGVLEGERLRLFAGAGIVAGSDPAAEVLETGAKLATLTRALGLEAQV